MSIQSVQIILSHAIDDAEFAKVLVSQPQVTLADYCLSAEEAAVFECLTFNELIQLPTARKRRIFSDLDPNAVCDPWGE